MGNIHCDCLINDALSAYLKAKELLTDIKFPLTYNDKYNRTPFNIQSNLYKNKIRRAKSLLHKCSSIADANYLLAIIYSYDTSHTKVNPFSYEVTPNLALNYMKTAAKKGHTKAIEILPQLEKEDEERRSAENDNRRELLNQINAIQKPYWDRIDRERQEREELLAKHPEIPILEQIRDNQDSIKRAINAIPAVYPYRY